MECRHKTENDENRSICRIAEQMLGSIARQPGEAALQDLHRGASLASCLQKSPRHAEGPDGARSRYAPTRMFQ